MAFPDVYDWIFRACQWKEGRVEPLELTLFADYKCPVLLRAKPYEGKMSLRFDFLEGGVSIGKYEIGNCSEESMQNNLLPLLLWLFFDPFILRSSKVICTAFSSYLAMFQEAKELKLEKSIIEPTKYKLVFNHLISAGCSSFPISMEDEGVFEILAQTQQKTLLLIGEARTHHFMGFLASSLNLFSSLYSKSRPSWMQKIPEESSMMQRIFEKSSIQGWQMQWIFERLSRVSYSSNSGRSWMITSYSPLFSMTTTNKYRSLTERAHLHWAEAERASLRRALKNKLLHCVLLFEPLVTLRSDCIEVCLQMDNVRCEVLPLDQISGGSKRDFPKERHFPAKICLRIGPENGHGVQSVSLSLSSPNPETDIGTGRSYEASFEAPKKVGFKASASMTSTERIKKWEFEHSVVNNTHANIDWTLCDTATGKAVFDNGPTNFSFLSGKTDRSIYRAFTKQGGVVFAKDEYGRPITWKLKRDLVGQTLKWDIHASIWLTYWPNTDGIRYFETKRHDFHQVVDLTLPRSSSSTPN